MSYQDLKADPKRSVKDLAGRRTPFSVSNDGIEALAKINEAEQGKTISIADMNLLEENYQRDKKGQSPRMEIDDRDILRAESERDLYPDFTDENSHEENISRNNVAESEETSSEEESYEDTNPEPESDNYSEEE